MMRFQFSLFLVGFCLSFIDCVFVKSNCRACEYELSGGQVSRRENEPSRTITVCICLSVYFSPTRACLSDINILRLKYRTFLFPQAITFFFSRFHVPCLKSFADLSCICILLTTFVHTSSLLNFLPFSTFSFPQIYLPWNFPPLSLRAAEIFCCRDCSSLSCWHKDSCLAASLSFLSASRENPSSSQNQSCKKGFK